MKKIYLFLFLANSLTSIAIYAQGSVEVFAKDCRDPYNEINLPYLKVFKNDRFIRSVVIDWDAEAWDRLTIKNLEEGEYRIDYTSIFGKIISKNIYASDDIINNVSICMDYIDYNNIEQSLFIDRLANNEKYNLRYILVSCSHNLDKYLSVKRMAGSYYATYDENEKKLSKEEVDILRRFEIELYHIETLGNEYFSSRQEDYLITYNGSEIKIRDGHNVWNGFAHLLYKLGFRLQS
jgi:hypothetical protein